MSIKLTPEQLDTLLYLAKEIGYAKTAKHFKIVRGIKISETTVRKLYLKCIHINRKQ